MAGQGGVSRFEGLSDTHKLYQLGLAQEINREVCPLFGASISIVVIAFFFRCLISYGAAFQHGGPLVVDI
jgi:hypothetical protein